MDTSEEASEKYQKLFEQAMTDNNLHDIKQIITDLHTESLVEVCLAKAYDKLKLLNVPLNETIENFVVDKLVSLRFFSERNVENSKDVPVSLDDVTDRLDKLVKLIEELTQRITGIAQTRSIFVYMCRSITKHLHILKYQLKSTYNKLPWAEMEFCFVALVMNVVRPQDADDIFELVLHRPRILRHLDNFRKGLLKLRPELSAKSVATRPRLANRGQMISSVLAFMPEFEELYRDYDLVKDVSSLRRIDHYISMCGGLGFDGPPDEHRKLVIERTLQVIGEMLKSSPDSPNVSEQVQTMLVDAAPRNLKEIITALRDSLSHTESLPQKIDMENYDAPGFFESVSDDLARIHVEIVSVLFERRLKALEVFCGDVLECETLEEARNLVEGIDVISFKGVKVQDIFLKDVVKTELLLEELTALLPDVASDADVLLKEVENVLETEKMKVANGVRKYEMFVESVQLALLEIKRSGDSTYIKQLFTLIFHVLSVSKQATNSLYSIGEPIMRIRSMMKDKLCFNYGARIEKVFSDILNVAVFKSKRLDDIGKFKTNLQKSQLDVVRQRECIDSILDKVEGSLKTESERVTFQRGVTGKKDVYQLRLDLIKLIEDKISQATGTEDDDTIIELIRKVKMKKQNEEAFINSYADGAYDTCKDTIKKIDDPYGLFVKSMSDLDIFSYQKQQKALKLFLSSLKLKKFPLEEVMKSFTDQSEAEIQEYINKRIKMLSNMLSLPSDIDTQSFINKIEKSETSKVITELILLDVMNILESASLFVDDKLFFDDASPLLLGKSLRNYLAHGNTLVDILPFDVTKTVACNALKLLQESDKLINRKDVLIGKRGNNRSSRSKCYLESLDDLTMQSLFYATVQSNDVDNVRECLAQGANLKARDIDGQNALHFAASKDSLESLIFCMEHGLDYSTRNSCGYTALEVAIEHGSSRIFERCLEWSRANLNPDRTFFLAAKHNQLDILHRLLQYYGDFSPECVDISLSLASMSGHAPIVRAILEKFSKYKDMLIKVDALHKACYFGHKDVVEVLLRFGFSVDAVMSNGELPIQAAISGGHCDIVEVLLQNGSKCDFDSVEDDANVNDLDELIANSSSADITDQSLRYDPENVSLSPIILAAMTGREDIFKVLVQNGANVNSMYRDVATPLSMACTFDKPHIVKSIIASGGDVNFAPRSGRTPLHQASESGTTDIAKTLLKHGADVNKTTVGNYTAAHFAAYHGHHDILKLLLSHGCDIQATSDEAKTVLHLAVEADHQDIVEHLADRGADVNAVDKFGYSPLHLASRTGNDGVLDTLLRRGATTIDRPDSDGNTPLHFAASYGHVRCARALLRRGAPADPINSVGATPLIYAVEGGHALLAATLLDAGARCDVHRPLHLASKNDLNGVVAKLLALGADADARDSADVTALHLACAYGHRDVVTTLLRCGAGINTRTPDGYTPLYLASRGGAEDVVAVLLRHGADATAAETQGIGPLHAACEAGHRRVAERLLEAGADHEAVDAAGSTPLHAACLKGHLDVVRVLHEHGVELSGRTGSEESVLHLASESGSAPLVVYVLRHGAEVDAVDEEGFTALHVAAQNGRAKVVRALLAAGAQVGAEGPDGVTALHMAADGGGAAVVEELVTAGAAVDGTMQSGETALHVAAGCGNVEVVVALLKAGAVASLRDADGCTAVEKALQAGHAEVVEVLLSGEGRAPVSEGFVLDEL